MDLALTDDTHDLKVTGYDLSLVTGTDLMIQRLKQSLWFFQGEWYLDITDGVPYYQDVLKKAPDRITVESVIKAAIIETPGVTELTAFEIEYENAPRRLLVTFSVDTVYGNLSLSEEV